VTARRITREMLCRTIADWVDEAEALSSSDDLPRAVYHLTASMRQALGVLEVVGIEGADGILPKVAKPD